MNFNYKGSFNKYGKQDSRNKPTASKSSANHLTNLESVVQQNIIDSTNGTANNQITQPNTHAHSIENILRKPLDARNLTEDHLQEAEESHLQEQPQNSATIKHNNNHERPGTVEFQNSANALDHTIGLTTELLKQRLLRNDRQALMHGQSLGLSQTETLDWKRLPLKKRQKVVFYQQSIPVMDLPQLSPQPPDSQTDVPLLNKELIVMREHQQTFYTHLKVKKSHQQSIPVMDLPQLSPQPGDSKTGVSFSNKELIVETQTTHRKMFYTHLKLTKPLTQSQIQERTETQLRRQHLSNQDISHFKRIQPSDREEEHGLQKLLQENASINISPNPKVSSTELQNECLPYKIDHSNFKSMNIDDQSSQSPNSSLNIANELSQSHNSSLNNSSQLMPFLTSSISSSSQQFQKETQLNPEQSCESVLQSDFQSLETSNLQLSQSPSLLVSQSQTLSLDKSGELTQSQTSPFLSSSLQSEKEFLVDSERTRCESVLPSDLQSLEAVDLQIPQSPNTLLNLSSKILQCQTSSLNISSQLPQSRNSSLVHYSQLTESQTSPMNTFSDQLEQESELNSEQETCKNVFLSDRQSLEASDLQMSQSRNLLLNLLSRPSFSQRSPLNISNQLSQSQTLSLDIASQLTQLQTSRFLRYIQESQEATPPSPEQASCESLIPRDLQSLEASDLTPKIDQTIEELLNSYLTDKD